MPPRLTGLTKLTLETAPTVCHECIWWQTRGRREVDKDRWIQKAEEDWGAWGTVYHDADGRLLGSMQYGPAALFPRAAELPAGPPSSDAVLVTCAYVVDAHSPWAMQSLFLAAIGDGASGEPAETSVVNQIANWNPNLFLYLGDVYEKGSPAEFVNYYDGGGTLYGRFRAISNPTVGNHEYSFDAQASGYFDYWDNVPHYYSFNAAGWHFISLDSTSQYGQTSPGTAQYQWLQQDLAADNAACTLVYYHHPLYNVGPEGPTTRMSGIWSMLVQHGGVLVLNGHDHDYQRYVPLDSAGVPNVNGVTEIVAGSGGMGLYASLGCQGCHSLDGSPSSGPTFKGLYGSMLKLTNGQSVKANDAYLLESILDPDKQIVAGYQPGVMSAVIKQGQVSQADAKTLVQFIKGHK